MTDKKIKILTLSDHPLSPSGVGTQTKYIIDGMLKTGKYEFVSFGGAIKHDTYQPQKTEQYGDDWIIFPVDGYGSQDQIRSVLRTHRPDILWFMTDPRFFPWLWEIENEIRRHIPMVYYHVWDNFPYPDFNIPYYESNDYIACISKVTHELIDNLVPDVPHSYIPHAVDGEVFYKLPAEVVKEFRQKQFPDEKNPNRMIFMWNNRNARRKQSGTLLWWFKEFLDKVGHENACLIMHTDPKDVHGQDLQKLVERLGLINGEVLFSREKIDTPTLAIMYNLADCTINISDAEGFGLATLESLACETPIIVNMTGGLQEQVTNGKEWFGIGIEPASKAIIGSQEVPYIYEDRLNKEEFLEAMTTFYNTSPEGRAEWGANGCKHVNTNYNFNTFLETWDKTLTEIHETGGSWKDRKNYRPYYIKEL